MGRFGLTIARDGDRTASRGTRAVEGGTTSCPTLPEVPNLPRPTVAPDPGQTLRVDHRDHVRLIREGVVGGGATWADLGSGEGAFTLALADLLGESGSIYSVDRDGSALQTQLQGLRGAFPAVSITPIVGDFSTPLELPPLDGIVMANSLHFERDKLEVLRLVHGYLRPGGRLVLVEYDADRGNPWVPFPLSFGTWSRLAVEAGFRDTRRLASVPSRFLGSIYSARSLR